MEKSHKLLLYLVFILVFSGCVEDKQLENSLNKFKKIESPSNETNYVTILSKPNYPLTTIEFDIHELINEERTRRGLQPLRWNADIADVARKHSNYLAVENKPLTDFYIPCPQPIIHHEDFKFGLYHDDRLHNNGIYYFGASGENIALIQLSDNKTYQSVEAFTCPKEEEEIIYLIPGKGIVDFPSEDYLKKEIERRKEIIKNQPKVKWIKVDWKSPKEIAEEVFSVWMESDEHRANIVFPNYNEEGIGIAEVNDFLIVTQVLIERVDCGYEGGKCCRKPGYIPYCFEPLKCINGICTSNQTYPEGYYPYKYYGYEFFDEKYGIYSYIFLIF